MSWWGVFVGGTLGWMVGGPIGALIGAHIGRNFSQGVAGTDRLGGRRHTHQQQNKVQMIFYVTTFSVMGHICKADGTVSQDEISLAKRIMRQMDLSPEQHKMAMDLFNQGKQNDFAFIDILTQFKQEIGYQPNLIRMFVEIQIMAAYADGVLHPKERALLETICEYLNISLSELDHLCNTIGNRNQSTGRQEMSLDTAYQALNIKSSASDSKVKNSYRRLMSQHHPDKLVSKGLPEEMMKVAHTRTQEIRKAYEVIKKDRGMK